MAGNLQDLGLLALGGSEPEEILLDLALGDQVRFRMREAGFGGYHWYISEASGGTAMITAQSVAGQNQHQVNLIAFAEGSSRFRLREARPFSPEDAVREIVLYVTVVKVKV